jgi:hypothetical protein
MIPRIDQHRMGVNVGVGRALYFAWGVDGSDRSVGGTTCLSTLGLLEFVSLCDSCLVTPKSFAAGRRCSNILAVGLVQQLQRSVKSFYPDFVV